VSNYSAYHQNSNSHWRFAREIVGDGVRVRGRNLSATEFACLDGVAGVLDLCSAGETKPLVENWRKYSMREWVGALVPAHSLFWKEYKRSHE